MKFSFAKRLERYCTPDAPSVAELHPTGESASMRPLAVLAAFACLASCLASQSIGTPVNVLFPSNNNLNPGDQEIVVAEDGSFAAVLGSLTTIGDVVIVDLNKSGSPAIGTSLIFPGSNDVSVSNRALVASRRSHFMVCYGLSGSVGDLVFITRNGAGAWTATNVVFPSGNDVPSVGTRPVISDDEQFIVCRGLSAIGEFVIIPVNVSAGVYAPGTPFNVAGPANTVPLSAIDPVIAPNGLSFAITSSNGAIGDLIFAIVGRPVTPANTTIGNVLFPAGNNVLSTLVPPVASPTSNYYVTYGQPGTGDVVIVAVNATGTPVGFNNVLFPAGNNVGYTTSPPPPPSVSGDGRLIATNGSGSTTGDVVLVPVDATGIPGGAANVAFPSSNNVANLDLPPVVSSDAKLVLQRGSATIGDLVAMQVAFLSPTSISGTTQNILYPSNNNFPATGAHVALAPDRSYAATLGTGSIGDLVITPLDLAGVAQTPINVLYPSSNNVPNLGTTPRISREGNYVLTSGMSTVGDAVITGVGINYATGFVQNGFTANVLYAASNDNTPTSREPVFSPTTQFVVSAGATTIGDLVFIPLLDPFPRFLARGDIGTNVPTRLFSPTDAGKTVFGVAALGRNLGIPLPDGRTFPLNNDALLMLTVNPNPFLVGFVGVLDANGVYDMGTINVPPAVGLEGIFIYLAFAVFDPAASLGIGTISRPSVFVVE